MDVVVVGAGINGSWTALHLAKQGYKVILIEQFPLPHTRGSSHGQSRGIRKAYPEPFLTHMMEDAYEQWHQLEKETGVHLMKETGLLVTGKRDDPYFADTVKSFEVNPGSSYAVHDPKGMSRTFPNLTMESNIWGCYDPAAGVLMADKALKTVWSLFQNSGGTIIDNCLVEKVVPFGDRTKIFLDSGRALTSKAVVICAGPWTNRLLEPLGWRLPLNPIKIPVFYYKANGHIPHTFIFDDDELRTHVWGIPELEYKGLVKICLHTGPNINPESRDIVDVTPDKERLREYISKNFPNVEPTPSIEESCIYTVSPDGVHILDKHPKYPNIVVGCGFSGSGFKLGPVTGEFLANLATGKPPKFSNEPFLASRFDSVGTSSLQSYL